MGHVAVSAPACRWWRAEHKAGRGGDGRLVNTATGLLLYGGAGQSNYVAAKAGVLAFTEAVATEMAPYGVTANTIMPSARTRLAAIGWRIDRNAERTPDDFDPTDPTHVAELVCYLASPGAGWISGQCFQVRGGTIEHVRTWEVRDQVERHDRGWTAPDLASEIPRLFGRRPRSGPTRRRRPGGTGTTPAGPPRLHPPTDERTNRPGTCSNARRRSATLAAPPTLSLGPVDCRGPDG